MVMAETALSTSPKAVWIRCTTCLTVSPLRSPAIRTLESRISPTGLVPGRSVSRLAVADDLLHIRSELGIHHGFIAEFLCVGLGEGDGLGEEMRIIAIATIIQRLPRTNCVSAAYND